MNILIVGCGRLGAALASAMSDHGHDVAVMDKRSDSFERLDDGFTGLTFKGVPIDNDDLEAAGIESCDVVCAVTNNDNENIMVAQIAKEIYKVPKVLAGIEDPEKEAVFQQYGLNSVCSTLLTLDAVVSAIDGYEEQNWLQFGNHRVKFYTMSIPKEYIGLKALEIQFEENEVLYAIINEGGKFTLVNNYNILLREGDTLIFSKIVD
ncbi:MAG: TrkA family potassium uptake protein [Ruminococcaceae bacterium]|nr:TrkA family potassium uptake protein [Oscillospiraceae bacterium]MBD5116934.1 TrkA family potassium uptake protein [Oscillospiraceae bacterium]